MSIDAMRKNYDAGSLNEQDVLPDPLAQFRQWFDEAIMAQRSKLEMRGVEVNAMTLATSDQDGNPSARVVLLKGLSDEGFAFYTNHTSHKAQDLEQNPKAALNFFWGPLERQIRVNGHVRKLSYEEAAAYFASRPRGSQLGAWVSNQSQAIEDRSVLEQQLAEIEKRFEGQDVPMPEFWGGYVVIPGSIEFWQGRADRLHDRIRYTRKAEGWKIQRLAP